MDTFNTLSQNLKSKISKFNKLNSSLPEHVEYQGNYDNPWYEIPIGVVQENGKNVELSIDLRSNPHTLITGHGGAGKTVLQRSFIKHCIKHPNDWRFLGVDVHHMELSPYRFHEPTVMAIATDIADGVETIRYAKEEMMERYKEMETHGVNNFKDLPTQICAVMVMIDESYMFLAPSGSKADEGKEEDALKGEASKLIGDIARLGRAAGIHLVLSTRFVDSPTFNNRLLMDLGNRIMIGHADAETTEAVFGNESVRPDSMKSGRGYIQTSQISKEFQAYYTPEDLNLLLTGQADAEV